MRPHPSVTRSVSWGAWGAAAGVVIGALIGWYLAETQIWSHLCEGNGLQVPVGMFFGCVAGLMCGVGASVSFGIWSRRRARRSRP